jgi:hypothetical protein
VEYAFRQAMSRSATAEEREVLLGLVAEHLNEYRVDSAAADALLTVGVRPIPSDIPRAELAAWTNAARVILNLHEVITRN